MLYIGAAYQWGTFFFEFLFFLTSLEGTETRMFLVLDDRLKYVMIFIAKPTVPTVRRWGYLPPKTEIKSHRY